MIFSVSVENNFTTVFFLRPSGTFFVGGYMIYPGLKPRAEFYRPYGTYPVLVFPEQFMEHTGKLRDNCEKRKVQLQKCGRFCKSRWNTGTAASPLKWKQNSPVRARGAVSPVRI